MQTKSRPLPAAVGASVGQQATRLRPRSGSAICCLQAAWWSRRLHARFSVVLQFLRLRGGEGVRL